MSVQQEGAVRDRSGRLPLRLREQIIGAWDLVSYTDTDENGKTSHPMGKDATGILLYTPDGYMSAQVMVAGRAAYASGDRHQGTAKEEKAALEGYVAYAGPFYVDEETGRVGHRMSVSLFPNSLADLQERDVEVDGDRLTLSSDPVASHGKVRSSRLVWKRAQPNLEAGFPDE